MKYKLPPIFIFLFLTSVLWSQQTALDSLKLKTYDELKYVIEDTKGKDLKLNCIQAFLEKAKKEHNIIEIAEGYKYKSLSTYPDSLSVIYADSIIKLTKNINDIKFPASAYIIKGNVCFELGDYKKSLDQYLIAIDLAKKNNNSIQYLNLKFNIGLLKNNLGERKEAQKIFKSYLDQIEQENDNSHTNYIKGLYALADSYTYSKESNTADVYIKKGIYYALKSNDNYLYPYFILISGINNYFKKDFTNAIDSLRKAKTLLKLNDFEQTRIATSDYYIGKSLYELNRKGESFIYFNKVDSLLHITKDVTPELIDSYNYLIEDSKITNNIKVQVRHINSLIQFDSILDSNYKYIKNTLTKKYDTPELILEKEKLISELNENETILNNRVIILIIVLIISILILYYFIRKNSLNRKKYDLLVQEIKCTQKNKIVEIGDIGISEHVINDILTKLENFEASDKFVSKIYTLNSLSKELNTNSSYLSKVINVTRETNFTQYLNDLKIDFTVNRLSSDKRFRSYTIKAISEESGFNNAQSFSVAFHKKTGIYPSYFIKKLHNES